jgi:hypothetical protein
MAIKKDDEDAEMVDGHNSNEIDTSAENQQFFSYNHEQQD